MRELLERRVLGAIRWRDAVSDNVINLPLEVSSGTATFTRNLSGLFVITAANGLEKYTATFDLDSLPAPDAKPIKSARNTVICNTLFAVILRPIVYMLKPLSPRHVFWAADCLILSEYRRPS